jgi:acyl dehydratase
MRYLSQTLYFRQPVSVGDTIAVTATVTDKADMSNWVTLKKVCRNQRGEIVIEGEAAVMPPRS